MATKQVTSYEEACKVLGIDPEATLPDVSNVREPLRKHLMATCKLSTILEVVNGDWKADLADTGQWKYYPWFRIVKDKSKPSGFGLSCYDSGVSDTVTHLGARLACKSEAAAKYMGETFTALYEELLG